MKVDSYALSMSSSYNFYQKDGLQSSLQTTHTNKEFNNQTDVNVKTSTTFTTGEKRLNFEEKMMALIKIVDKSIALLKGIKDELNEVQDRGFNFVDSQKLSLSTKGIIKAADKTIQIDVEFNLHRTFLSDINPNLQALKKSDPLVISLDTKMPEFLDEKVSFDIDADGEVDQISRLAKNSGFLALDINQNGKIDNGLELFGTRTGNGFAELMKFDYDKNGWIDESDEIFHKLRIFQNDKDERKLLALGEVGIGAIFLGSMDLKFDYKDRQNNTIAQLKSAGIFLSESGGLGAVSGVDFSKFSNERVLTSQEVGIKSYVFKTQDTKGVDKMV